jgi:hypothetical protein
MGDTWDITHAKVLLTKSRKFDKSQLKRVDRTVFFYFPPALFTEAPDDRFTSGQTMNLARPAKSDCGPLNWILIG